ncbi:helix-turn-helix domain-containing protein [Puniceicoccus vermicola]|uniref:Helix-turn-helix domain-containing protein n=1 Tax=Puniceicoccus vermicola TaxID=388746 RepID=A0A7X1B230_9BACT|nr:helix-turn-helix transcriptional regulator [Puniceicoccus vermicola]MBC2604097.1 helix-turn-helix domain-containing protein [Puniceicoccus vermicola]
MDELSNHPHVGGLQTVILIELRKETGLTQRQLAHLLKREHSFIGRIELGERRLNVIEFWEHCRICGSDPAVVAANVFKAFEHDKIRSLATIIHLKKVYHQ